MLEHKKLIITVISLALIGVLALFAYSTTIRPVRVELGQISNEHIGKIITTNGTISSARTLSDGSLSMEICDMNTLANISVYVQANAYESWTGNLTPGTIIEVTGEVSQYQEEMEISVASARDMVIISEPATQSYDLWTVMDSIEMFDGMVIRTNGSMLDVTVIHSDGALIGTGFTLYQRYDNQSYSLKCMAFDVDLTGVYDDWDLINVIGQISYYSNSGSWQLIVNSIE